MFGKIISFILGKNEDTEKYPLPKHVQEFLPYASSPLVALDLVRWLMRTLDVSMSEAEIILYLIAKDSPATVQMIDDEITHVTPGHVERLVRKLIASGHLVRTVQPDCIVVYEVNPKIVNVIKKKS